MYMQNVEPVVEGEFPRLIVMLTYNDMTVNDAEEVFLHCKDSKAKCWGFKEAPLPIEKMKRLYSKMKECGKTTFLEVVAYSEEEGLEGARIARECGCDCLMGTKFHDSILRLCKEAGIKYLPFVGTIEGRPSVLKGSISEIVKEAKAVISKGADGIDLLGYRYEGDPEKLNRAVVEEVEAPVCIAGSIDSFERLGQVKNAAPHSFTIGSAFFDKKFGDDFATQINTVCDFIDSAK